MLLALTATARSEEPVLISDLNFPLIRLPATFDSQRTTKRVDLLAGKEVEIINVRGPGCVRHFWITATQPEALDIEVYCDGAPQAQIKMSLHRFFGVLLGKEPYRIESAAIKLLPSNGYNCYFPIPFQTSCRIVLRARAESRSSVWSMVDWQKYEPQVQLTASRLHAVFTEEKPAGAFGSTLLGAVRGRGFVAGMFHAITRHDDTDMIWHTGGDTWLIDGEINPHVLRGIGSEDVFGYSFGVYKDSSQWVGGVRVVGENATASEMVAYRFFGPDPVAFKSSLVLRFGTRANDVESVLYYYKDSNFTAPVVQTPLEWTITGPFSGKSAADFERAEFPERPRPEWPTTWEWGKRTLSAVTTAPEITWIDFSRWYRANKGGNTGTQPVNAAAYAETEIHSATDRKVVVRLGFDDWMKLWLNDKPIATLKHDDGFSIGEVPLTLQAGRNVLRIKLSNSDNEEWRCWAFSCVIEDAKLGR